MFFHLAGRRNKAKQKDSSSGQTSRDNHQIGNSGVGSTVNHHSYVPEIKENGIGHTPNASAASHTQTCDTCHRFEIDLKKLRNELNHMKQVEIELRQKCENNANIKSSLLAKQKENEELEKK